MHVANSDSGPLLRFCGDNVRFICGLISSCEQNGKIFFSFILMKNKAKTSTKIPFTPKVKVTFEDSYAIPITIVLNIPLLNIHGAVTLHRFTSLDFCNLSIILIHCKTSVRKFGLLLNEVSFRRSYHRKQTM